MRVYITEGSIVDAQVDALVLGIFEGVTEPGGAAGAVDKAVGGLIGKVLAAKEFKGELNETLALHLGGGQPYRKVVLVGLGKQEDLTTERVRQVTASGVRAAAKGGVKKIGTPLHGAGAGGLDPADAAQALAEGALMGLYKYEVYKSGDKSEPIEIAVYEQDAGKVEAAKPALERGAILAESTNWARDLVNTPSNDLTPTILAGKAKQMAAEVGLECEILDQTDMERLGMGSLLGVAKGSAEEPKMIVLRYRGSDDEQPFALVGKGVCFDTGGISLKPPQGMAAMKGDMAGAAAVLGAMRAIALLKPNQHVIAVAPCVENMPSGTSLKPGDVVKAMTGKTIEVDNTDAEGRLILADAVAYAESLGAHTIVDVATLTGACVIALGNLYTGLVSTDDELAESIIEAGKAVGERYCRLPADPEYKEQYKSDVADIKNVGGREAGAITGALIIGEFVEKAKWAHLDIAGTGDNSKDRHYMVKGATGAGVRTLTELICRA